MAARWRRMRPGEVSGDPKRTKERKGHTQSIKIKSHRLRQLLRRLGTSPILCQLDKQTNVHTQRQAKKASRLGADMLQHCLTGSLKRLDQLAGFGQEGKTRLALSR